MDNQIKASAQQLLETLKTYTDKVTSEAAISNDERKQALSMAKRRVIFPATMAFLVKQPMNF